MKIEIENTRKRGQYKKSNLNKQKDYSSSSDSYLHPFLILVGSIAPFDPYRQDRICFQSLPLAYGSILASKPEELNIFTARIRTFPRGNTI